LKAHFGFDDAIKAFLLQGALPFSTVLSEQRICSVFRKHGCSMNGVYSTAIVLWAFMSQVMRDGKEAACQSAVARIVAYLTKRGRHAPVANTGNYCRARAKLPERALKELSDTIAQEAQASAKPSWLWKGMSAKLVDGFTFKMPDTPENQRAYPQHTAQKPGLGFPIARVLGVLSLATGCLLDAAVGPFSGKETGETSLLRRLINSFSKGDVVVADRYFCSYWMIVAFMQINVQICFRKKKNRHTDFRRGKRLGKQDHIIQWQRPKRPLWMSKEYYETMPLVITLREMKYAIEGPGRKSGPFVVVTTLLEHQGEDGVSYDDIAELFGFRWNAELDIRSIKTFMNLDFVRCMSPEMVRRELWTTLLAYNLIRITIATAASLHDRAPRQISFVSACQYILASWQEIASMRSANEIKQYVSSLLRQIASCQVGHRPGRFEPRVVKRRRDQYTLMVQPRNELRKRLRKGDNTY
jgi:putative transposase